MEVVRSLWSVGIKKSEMRSIDTALLYLRIVIGGMLLLHNIGKMQTYSETISDYSPLDGLSAPTWYIIFSIVECVTALMIIIGWRVRLAAVVLVIGTIVALGLYFPHSSMMNIELNGVYVFIYIYLFMSGGGLYSFDSARQQRRVINSDK